MDHPALAGEGLRADGEARGILLGRAHDGHDRQALTAREIEVALVVGGAAEDGARAVVHQDEVGDVDRQRPGGVEGVHRADAGVEAALLRRLQRGDRGAEPLAFGDEVPQGGIAGRDGARQGMVGRDRQETRTEQRVGPRRVDVQRRGVGGGGGRGVERPAHQQPLRLADPVALHEAHLLRPAIQAVEGGQQIVGVVGDLEEPLHEVALLDRRAGAPALAVDHLLVGEHGLVDRVPVDLRLAAIDEPGVEETQEHRLLVLVVAGIAGRDLARPVERQPHALELAPHGGDVGIGPGGGMRLVLHRRVLGGHAESVPAHGMDHVAAGRATVAGDHVAHRVVAHMPHVDAPGGIGKHLQHVVFGARIVVAGAKSLAVRPHGLPMRLCFAGVVTVVQGSVPSLSRESGGVAGSEHDWESGSIRGAGLGFGVTSTVGRG